MKALQTIESAKATPEEILYSQLLDISAEISAKLDAERTPWEPSDHFLYNWASEIHHPCLKHLVHCRVDWKQRQPISIESMWRVKEGIRIESEVKKWYLDIDYEITQSQRKFKTDDPGMEEFYELWISGKIDGMSPLKRKLPAPFSHLREAPAEVKTVNPNYWNSTKTVEDIKQHPKFWINKIPSQLNIYLAFTRSPGGFLIIVTFGKKPRILPMLFDQALWDRDRAVARKVNAHVEAGTYPEPIPFDPTVCGMCDFNHICKPIAPTKMSQIDPLDIFKLEMYLELKDQKKKFDELHSELIGTKKKPGKYHGIDGIIEDIEISTSSYMKKKYEVPTEVKKKYQVDDDEVITTTIDRIGP